MVVLPRVAISKVLNSSERLDLLKKLEAIGSSNLPNYMFQKLLYPIDNYYLKNREFLSRYLLLAATLDQQADSDSAKNTVVSLYVRFGADFFLNPHRYINQLYSILGLVASLYKPKTRVLRLKNESIMLLRIGGFLLTLINVASRYGGLLNYLNSANTPRDLLNILLKDPLLSGLLYEKAARMYTGWVSHPRLWINISHGKWRVSEIPMAINGHVCKVLARTGFLSSVLVENTNSYIVEAEKERNNIEAEVDYIYPNGDKLFIDFGAFFIGITYCHEASPHCTICPLGQLCRRNINFRAY